MVEIKLKNNSNIPGKLLSAPAGSAEKKKRGRSVSEYKKSLQEKQTLKRLYGMSEKQFKKYVKDALSKIRKVENVSDELVKLLEKRLDNVVFRAGFAKSRAMARQLVTHSYFLVSGKSVNIPSFQLSKGDVISIKDTKRKKLVFENLTQTLKKAEAPSWLKLNKDNIAIEVTGEPTLTEASVPVEISLIFEFYSR